MSEFRYLIVDLEDVIAQQVPNSGCYDESQNSDDNYGGGQQRGGVFLQDSHLIDSDTVSFRIL